MLEPHGVIWHPITHAFVRFPKKEWIQPIQVEIPEECAKEPCYSKVNQFIEAGLVDEHYYCVLCDDDSFGTGFFDEIHKYPSDIIIPSVYEPKHGLLLACAENMKPSRCSFQQLVIKGRILKNYRYNNFCQADGQLLERVFMENEVKFAPSALVLANSI